MKHGTIKPISIATKDLQKGLKLPAVFLLFCCAACLCSWATPLFCSPCHPVHLLATLTCTQHMNPGAKVCFCACFFILVMFFVAAHSVCLRCGRSDEARHQQSLRPLLSQTALTAEQQSHTQQQFTKPSSSKRFAQLHSTFQLSLSEADKHSILSKLEALKDKLRGAADMMAAAQCHGASGNGRARAQSASRRPADRLDPLEAFMAQNLNELSLSPMAKDKRVGQVQAGEVHMPYTQISIPQ